MARSPSRDGSSRRPTPRSTAPSSSRPARQLRLQARVRRTPTVGLPGRHSRRPRGRRVRHLRADGLADRAADRPPRRPFRPRHGAAVDRPGSRCRPADALTRRRSRCPPHGGVRRRRQQRRPQDRALAADRLRPRLRMRPRCLLLRRVQAPHRPVAVARQGSHRRGGRGAAAATPRLRPRRPALAAQRGCSAPRRSRPPSAASSSCSSTASTPTPPRTGPPFLGRPL